MGVDELFGGQDSDGISKSGPQDEVRMGGFGCSIDDAELTSRLFDRLACWSPQMLSEMSGLEGADGCLPDAAHDDDKRCL